MYGVGNINFHGNVVPAGVVTGARNGLSKDAGNFVVLGQDLGDPDNPAEILNIREIPMPLGTFLALIDQANNKSTGLAPGDIIFQGDTTAPHAFEIQFLDTGAALGTGLIKFDPETDQRWTFEYQQGGIIQNIYFNNSGLLQLLSSLDMFNGPGIQIGTPGINGVGIAYTRQIIQLDSNTNVNVNHTGALYANGDAGVNTVANLPPAAKGAHFTFLVEAVGLNMQINANGTDTIRILSGVSSAGGNASSATQGDFLTLQCPNDGFWIATSVGGVWVLA